VTADAREISGTHLATARRAVSVALMVDVATGDIHSVRALLPPQGDLVWLLDRLGGRMGGWELDLVTGEGLWSDEAFRVLGLAPGAVEPTYEAFPERVHPDDREWVAALHREGIRTGTGYDARYRAMTPDGTVRTMRAIVELDTDEAGRTTRIAGILQDITDDDAAGGASRRPRAS